MANDPKMLGDALNKAGLRDYSYGEIRDYYKDKYDEKGWIGAYAQAISGSSSRSGKEYLAARRGIERVEAGRQSSSKYTSDKVASQVSRSQELPVKRDVVNLTIRAKQGDIRGGVRTTVDRTINVKVQFSGDLTWQDVWEAYDLDYDFAEEGDYGFGAYSVVAG